MKTATLRIALRIAALLSLCSLSLSATGQTVRPVINEMGDPGKGRIEYVNNGLTPLNVVLEPKSFTVSEDGEIAYRPLDPSIHLKLSTNSFRIQPQQTYYVFYEASAPQSPAWFVIYAAFSGFPFRTAQGMNVRLELPHTVYLLPKQGVQKSEIRVNHAELDAQQNKVILEVENTGDNFGRVQQTQLQYSNRKQEAPGFPIFPHSKRILEVALAQKAKGENVPIEVSFQFEKFKIEEKLQRRGNGSIPSLAEATTSPQAEAAISSVAELQKGNP